MAFKSELKKALETTGDGAALVPYDLEAFLEEELLKLQPLAQLVDVIQAESKTHEYSVRTSHPQAWFEGESTPANSKNSAYTRESVQLKIQRIWGSVTGFAQTVDEKFIDALAAELEGSLEGMANIMEYGLMWGAADDRDFSGDAYQYTGIIPRLFSDAPSNVIDAEGAKVSLDHLDQAMAQASGFRGVRQDPKLWIMGIRMKQIVDGLQTRIQIPLTSVTLADGKVDMAAYDRTAILESDFIVPAASTSSPSDGSGSAASGGALADADWDYRIASVTAYGEQEASAAIGATTTSGSDNSVDLTWTADPAAYLYMIFREKDGSGTFELLDIIAAKTYDAAGTVNGTVETYTDDGSQTAKAIKPLESDEQNILLANVNPTRGAAFVGKVDDMGRPVERLFSFVELARVKDTYDYLVKSYLALRIKHPNLFSMVRHVKTS